jgi:hypothetical protein
MAAGEKNIEELKSLVVTTLETNGVLGQIRAQLRANVYKAIDEDETRPKPMHRPPAKLKRRPLGHLMAEIVAEFFDFYQFRHSMSVFVPESNLGHKRRSRAEVATECGLGRVLQVVSILEQIIGIATSSSELRKGGDYCHSSASSTTASSPPPSATQTERKAALRPPLVVDSPVTLKDDLESSPRGAGAGARRRSKEDGDDRKTEGCLDDHINDTMRSNSQGQAGSSPSTTERSSGGEDDGSPEDGVARRKRWHNMKTRGGTKADHNVSPANLSGVSDCSSNSGPEEVEASLEGSGSAALSRGGSRDSFEEASVDVPAQVRSLPRSPPLSPSLRQQGSPAHSPHSVASGSSQSGRSAQIASVVGRIGIDSSKKPAPSLLHGGKVMSIPMDDEEVEIEESIEEDVDIEINSHSDYESSEANSGGF